jgi:catechol 2,3-dioxygenase-like lactoylglutathione lyase family enzyme
LGTNNLKRAIVFYDAALAPLGLSRRTLGGEEDWPDWAGWGSYQEAQGWQELALWICKPFDGQPATAGNGVMIAFKAQSWVAVRKFHQAGVSCGGTSEGEPGLRPHYGDDFFAAYLRDPDGNKLAAVCRGHTSEPL